MGHTLVLGYGNLDRGDDAVAHHVVNAVRRRLGQDDLSEYDFGWEQFGAEVDSAFVTQLVPALTQTLLEYERVVFVDAHAQTNGPAVECVPVDPNPQGASHVHQVTPSLLLALLQAMHGRELKAYVVSVRGHDFGFHRGLSPDTATLVEQAADCIMELMSGPLTVGPDVQSNG